MKTISAIKFLEHDEYFVLSENALMASRLQFLVNGEDIYKFQVENAKYDLFIRSVLRSFGGAFDSFVNIKEADIAKKNSINKMDVINILRELDKLEIISYQKQTDQPLLTFIKPRYKTEDLIVDRKYLEERKTVYHQKMMGMLAFVEHDICRSVQLLEYFEEKNAQKCGVCDICLKEKRALNGSIKEQMIQDVLKALKANKMVLNDLIKCIKKGAETEKLELIRMLLDANEIKKSEDFYYL